MEDIDIEVPRFFTCPISLQIMKDPVTAVTGITYDRDSIEQWLFSTGNASCPVTKQPLPPGSDLTPNHTLRRLIQAWCTDNSARGVARIPTPKPPLSKARLAALLADLAQPEYSGRLIKVIKQLEFLAAENDRNRRHMAECGVSTAVFAFVAESCFRPDRTEGLEEALSLLRLIRSNDTDNPPIGDDNELIMDCFTWILSSDRVESHVKTLGVLLLQSVVEASANPSCLSRLKPAFFAAIVGLLRGGGGQGEAARTTAALRVMLEACPKGQNRVALVESGAVFELVELDIGLGEPSGWARTTELVMGVLFHLCCCAEGRARLVGHGGGVAAVARRILRVSAVVDERAVMILWLVCRFSGTKQVVREMLEVGAVSKLCILMQAECAVYLKDKARQMFKAHSGDWNIDSPCLGAYPSPN